MKCFVYIDANHAPGSCLYVYAADKRDARAAVCREYGYSQLPRRHCLASVTP